MKVQNFQSVIEKFSTPINDGLQRILEKLPFNLRVKITLPFLFLAIVLGISAGYVVSRIVFDSIDQRFSNQLVESSKLAVEGMVVEENHLLATLRLLANTKEVDEAILANDPNLLRDLTFGTILNNQEEAVEFLDQDGIHVLAVHHKIGGRIEEYEFSSGNESIAQWDTVQKILARSVDDRGDKFSDYISAEWGDYFYVAGPIYNKHKEFIGIVMVGRTIPSLAQRLREVTLGQITFYSVDGMPITSTFITQPELATETAQNVLANQDEKSYRRELKSESIGINLDYEEILGPWKARGDSDLGILGVALGKSFLVKTTRVTRSQVILLASLSFVFVILIGWSLAYTITQPIYKLVNASRQVSKGDFQVQVADSSQDELSILTQSFNEMVFNLHTSRKALIESYDYTLEGWSKALGFRDKETKEHTSRVTELTVRLAEELSIDKSQIEQIRRGALLHDIGKMGVPDSILLKPGKLDEKEWEIIKQHPIYAHEMLKNIEFLQPALKIPYCHHENWDGSGYPRGLKGEGIPIEARIFALVDTWDALTSDRPYRGALSEEEACTIIRREVGTHFDPQVAEVFLRLIKDKKL